VNAVLVEGEQRIREHLARLARIPDAEWAFFRSLLRAERVPKHAIVLCEGEVERRMRFIVRGVFRLFRSLEEREVNLGFDGPDRFVCAYDSLVARAPSRFGLQALSAAELVVFDGAALDELYTRHACWERVGRKLLEENYARKVRKEDEARTLDPLERFARLVARAPWIRDVPQYHIASFLGIAPETLSRRLARPAAARTGSAKSCPS